MLVKIFWIFKLLKWHTGNTETSKNNCPSEIFANYWGSYPEILEFLFSKIQEYPWETSVVVYFDLILTNKASPPRTAASLIIGQSRHDGFLFYRCSRSKMLE